MDIIQGLHNVEAALGKDCHTTADRLVESLIEAGEQAWLGWLLYLLERLDLESKAVLESNRPYFLVELAGDLDDRLVNGGW